MKQYLIITFFISFTIIISSADFKVVNSNRVEFYEEGEPQDMSSGLFSAYINDGNSDYSRIKAKNILIRI